ncbi:unnamed protein product [Euphydryas editha]|uniref:Uncharacterized protein n=1 Tax=Euphydryas editha TaxID=104508 RepID=A0AAU9TP24_EUPED|nr:unnamed protein product [Euphydryas editha]
MSSKLALQSGKPRLVRVPSVDGWITTLECFIRITKILFEKYEASTKQLIKLWYNMKAKAREAKTKENIRNLTGGGPSVMDMDPTDTKVMDIDKNILTNIVVDIDSDIDGGVVILGDNNNEAWCKTPGKQNNQEKKKEEKANVDYKTPIKKNYDNFRTNNIDFLKCKILEEELEYIKKNYTKKN